MTGFSLDLSINLGSLIAMSGALITFVVAFTRIGGRIDLVAQRLGSVEEAVKQIAANDIRMATMEERLNNHVKMLATAQGDIANLRRGEGFISASRRNGVDGAY